MIAEEHLGESEQRSLSTLRGFSKLDLKCHFSQLSPPDLGLLQGEYRSELLSQGSGFASRLVNACFSLHGTWLAKAFVPINSERGVGYNLFDSRNGGPHKKLFMDTRLTDSHTDGNPCISIDYRGRNWGPIRLLRGEFRQYLPGVLLGIGYFGIRLGASEAFRRKIPFVMVGPKPVTNSLWSPVASAAA